MRSGYNSKQFILAQIKNSRISRKTSRSLLLILVSLIIEEVNRMKTITHRTIRDSQCSCFKFYLMEKYNWMIMLLTR